jgi:biopolymer transport protein ExbB/TolQ
VSKLSALSAVLLRSPLLWGAALACGCFGLIHGGIVTDPTVVRYLAGHWVEYVEVALFCVGISALAMKVGDLARQRSQPDDELLSAIPAGGQDPAEAADLATTFPEVDGYLPRRLREALDFVVRTGSPEDLQDHLKYLSDLDAARASQSYGLVRFIVWAIPIMGFLGTVIGITVAIANLSPTQLENISGVVAGLGTAFDTTATALALSMLLMFLQFLVDRSEQSLLARVDDTAWRLLAGRFQPLGADEGTALAVARLGDTLGRGAARLLESQEQAWQTLERTAAAGLEQVMAQAGERLETALARSLGESLDAATSHWSESLARTQAELAAVAAATRDIAGLQERLEANLATLATSGRFEETLATLSAAVQLLAVRAGDRPVAARLDPTDARCTGKAA